MAILVTSDDIIKSKQEAAAQKEAKQREEGAKRKNGWPREKLLRN